MKFLTISMALVFLSHGFSTVQAGGLRGGYQPNNATILPRSMEEMEAFQNVDVTLEGALADLTRLEIILKEAKPDNNNKAFFDSLRENLQKDFSSNNAGNTVGVINAVFGALDDLQSDNALDVVNGSLRITGAIANFFPPPKNAMANSLIALTSGIIGLFNPSTEESESMATQMENAVRNVMSSAAMDNFL
ncbi:MAG: hypothetical protein SGILL_002934 [Bacillariaceae sp.]